MELQLFSICVGFSLAMDRKHSLPLFILCNPTEILMLVTTSSMQLRFTCDQCLH